MIKAFWKGLAALALIAGAQPALAQARLFSSDSPLQITLTAPFPALIRADRANPRPFPATLAVSDGAGPPTTLPIEVRARGISRRISGFCGFPPLQLRFGDKAALKATLFKGQSKLKLVTYCQDHDDYEQRIMLEYLAYRLYNTVTPMSYRVRPARVTYRGGDKDKAVTRFGFLIEDIDDLAERNGVKALDLKPHQFTAYQLDQRAAARATLFEYLVGNLDWEFLAAAPGQACCHNSRFVAASEAFPLTAVTPVIYDFDFSGFVDAPYSGPPASVPVKKLTDRFYRGYCASTPEIPAAIDEFRSRRAAMTALIDNQPGLDAKFRAKTVRFLDGFFATLDDPGKVQTQIVKHCR